ncbi:MAG TPA: hypothetical protein DCX77_06825 [Acidimicrobiaceae bacterium]|nr:hypothetical protein [Acidimicrobiaceae bacterium]
MAGFDHFALACRDLQTGVDYVESLTGVRPAPGGPHPGVGTHNALLSLGTDVYLEIIAVDPEQPEPNQPRPFGIDDHDGLRLAAFAIHPGSEESIESVADVIRSHGTDPGPVSSMSRRKPDGEEISWRLTRSNRIGLVPFVIDWGDTPNPATVTPTGCSLVSVEGNDPDSVGIVELHSSLGLVSTVSEGPTSLRIVLDTPNGQVSLS